MLWICNNKLKINNEKSEFIIFGSSHMVNRVEQFELNIKGYTFLAKKEIHFLGVTIDQCLKFKTHILNIKKKIGVFIPIFYNLRNCFPTYILKVVYYSLIVSKIRYGIVIYGGNYKSNLTPIVKTQNRLVKIMSKMNQRGKAKRIDEIFTEMKLMNVYQMHIFGVMELYSKIHWYDIAIGNVNVVLNIVQYCYSLRRNSDFKLLVDKPKNKYFNHSFEYKIPMVINYLLLNDINIFVMNSHFELISKLKSFFRDVSMEDILKFF